MVSPMMKTSLLPMPLTFSTSQSICDFKGFRINFWMARSHSSRRTDSNICTICEVVDAHSDEVRYYPFERSISGKEGLYR